MERPGIHESLKPAVTEWSGSPLRAVRWSRWVPILMYHRVVAELPRNDPFHNCISVATFERQLAWLARRGYHTVPLTELLPLFDASGDTAPPLPRRPVAITLDDGYRDSHTYAWPALAQHGFTATIFLVSDAIGGYNHFDPAYRDQRIPMLPAAEIREMARHGIRFGSHSRSHPASLVELPADRLTDELEHSRSTIEQIVGAPIEHFSYPHSRVDHRIEAAVADAGYRLACAGVGNRFDPFCLHRVEGALAGPGRGIELAIRLRGFKALLRSRLAGLRRLVPHR